LTGFETGRYSRDVGQSGTTLTPQQVLFVTLIVRIAVVSLLAVMVVRYHRFRDLLTHERRGWPMKFFFAFSFGLVLTAGVAARLLRPLQRSRHHAGKGRFWRDSSRVRGVGRWWEPCWARPQSSPGNGRRCPSPSVADSRPAAYGGLSQRSDLRFSPFVLSDLHRYVWRLFRRFEIDWQIVLIAAPIALQLLQLVIDHRWPARIYALDPRTPFQTAMVYLGTILCIAAPIKIWNDARIEHRVREQEKLLMKARRSTP